jgi:predicted Fe-S protein YdhL (DUF1289 family)
MTQPVTRDAAAVAEAERQRRRAERRARLRAQVFDSSVPSPCVAICQMDEASRFCIGCGRTLDELRDWIVMTAEEKRAVLARIEAAKAAGG